MIVVTIIAFLVIRNTIIRENSEKPVVELENNQMLITSQSFEENSLIPKKFTCDGGNINPQLFIQNIPNGAKSLALIMDDPDAPRGTFTHWVLWNISPNTTEIKQESIPTGSSEGANGAGRIGYIGPCPPSGTHHYHFKLYALNTLLDLQAGAKKEELEKAMDGHVLEKTELVGLYER